MKCLAGLHSLNLFALFQICSADQHSFGGALGGYRIFYKKVMNDTNKVPKNYTIIFKYLGMKQPLFADIMIDVSTNSTGEIDVTYELQNMGATILLHNALHVTATISVFAIGSDLIQYKDGFDAKGCTIVYKKDATVSNITKQFSRNSVGLRQPDDELLYFENRNVTNISSFPSRAFEYSSNDSITYVGFSFNSPTAMALINTTYISEKEFSAVAYDMNTEHFVANISIYGFKSGNKPLNYFTLLGNHKRKNIS